MAKKKRATEEQEVQASGLPGNYDKYISITDKFARVNRLIVRDANARQTATSAARYNKETVRNYISDPIRNQKELRNAVVYLYGASPHFRRLIQYFVGLTDLSYVVTPHRIDPKTANVATTGRNYRKVLNALTAMNIRGQFPNILTVCLREDVFYGTMWVSDNSITIQQLPFERCAISSIEDNVLNISFDFSHFDRQEELLNYYPEEFRSKYNEYLKNKGTKWIELDSPTSFAIKCNKDFLDYAMPPFAGILREVYDLEDYKDLKLSKTAIENYAMVSMKLPMTKEGEWPLPFEQAREFWGNLDAVLPDEIGSVLSPMEIDKIDFDKAHGRDANTIAEAEQNLFTAAGVSSLLFNNEKASANALLLSIKVDQEVTFGVVKSIEDMVNRFLKHQGYGKNFKVNFLNVSAFNRKEMGDQYIKALQYGLPTIMMYAASQGLGQAEFDAMNYLENDVLGLKDVLVPLKSSATLSSQDIDGEAGRPKKDPEDLTDSGEQSSEDKDDWGSTEGME